MDTPKYLKSTNQRGTNTNVARVTRSTKKWLYCITIDPETGTDTGLEFAVNGLRGGKKVSGGSYWYPCQETELPEIAAENKASQDAAKAREQERNNRWQAKLAAVREANNPLYGYLDTTQPEYMFGKMKVVKYINAAKEENIILYTAQETEIVKSDYSGYYTGVRIDASSYKADRFGSERRFAMHLNTEGAESEYEALVALVAGSMWE